MNDLSKRIAALSPEQRAVFEQRLKQQGLSAPTVQVIGKRPAMDAIPLSFGQQRLWFLHQLDPASPAYNAPSAVRLNGPLDVDALRRSLNEVVGRHEALRTTFTTIDNHPVQEVAPQLDLPLPVVDLRTHPPDDRAAEALRLALQEFQRPFDLRHGPLLRTQLLRLDESEYQLLFTMHHIITDGWSTELLIAEMTALYAVLSSKQPLEAARLHPVGTQPPLQYPDFAVWQRDYLQGAVLESQLAYWRNQLADAPRLLSLPTDRPRPAVQSYHGTLTAFTLDQPLHQALTALAQRESATLFMLMLAAFKVLLYRWSGQDDLIVGTTMSGRNRSELSSVMGFFANSLALRTSLAHNPTFREMVQRVRATALAAFSHQDIPFELLVEKLNPERNLSHAPIFQVAFTLQNELLPTREVAGVKMQPLIIDSGTTKFDLTLFIWEGAHSLTGTLEYSSALFDPATIERLIDQLKVLLSAIVADPEQRVDQLPLLSAHQRTTVLELWNNTATAYPDDQCIHSLVAAQAARTPEAIAIAAGSASLTYRELNLRANQLAHHLQALGVTPESRVGICAEPSPEMVVGLLAILKAGGAYVPLDPAYPAERLQFMLADSQARIVLTQERLVAGLPAQELQIFCLDRDWPLIAALPTAKPSASVTPDNLAYVIYTSGSTGAPKGVLLAHRGAVNNLWWRQTTWPLDAADRMLQTYSLSFDPSVWNIFWPLIAGAAVVPVSVGQRWDSAALVRLMVEHGITATGISPAIHMLVLDQPAIASTKLRYIVSGGEVLSAELQRRFFEKLDAILCNCYGPTEATIDTTFWVCPRADEPRAAPIGHPLPNVQVYILDDRLEPAPVGVPGELYIGGVNLARGYQHRPDVTAERFIPHPFSNSHGARLYRTGDLARYRSDGAIEFLGRIDDQVKVRGFRIELGEIEGLLCQHPALREVAVVAQAEQLIAYIVPSDAQAPSTSDLRRYLQRRLPEHMIPAIFVTLEALPQLPNGKIDRKALPEVDGSRPTLEQSYVAPRTPTEEVLAMLWAEVLELDRVGIHDNFFDLGGHSLQANLLLSRVRDAFQISLPLQTMFESTTIAVLAELLVEHETAPGRTDKIARLIQRIKGSSREDLQKTLEQRRQQSRTDDQATRPDR